MAGAICSAGPFPMDEAFGLGIEGCCQCVSCWWSASLGAWFVPDNFGALHVNRQDRRGVWREYYCRRCLQDVTVAPTPET